MRALRLHLGIWCLASVGLATVMLQEVSSSHSRPLRSQELDEIRGTGPCYWNQPWNCVPQPYSCRSGGCDANNECVLDQAPYDKTTSGTTVFNSPEGLDGVGFPITVYCAQNWSCTLACELMGEDWVCNKGFSLDFIQPQTQQSATGNWCGGSGA